MRKLAVILVGLLLCLLCSGGKGAAYSASANPAAASLSVDDSFSIQWQCQRECNSNLSLPRVVSVISPESSVPSVLRTVQAVERLGVKCGGASVRGMLPAPEFQFRNLLTAGYAVDYYVYRLCRLII